MPDTLPDYAVQNREAWTKSNADHTDARAHESWGEKPHWGVWHQPESDIRVLPDVTGLDVIELGCGTAYWSAWLKRLGARRVVGVDVTPAQLDTARRMDAEYRLGIELVEANAEDVHLPEASFDLAFSEYGASIWCDPYKWIPEAARLLRSNGELMFMRHSDFVEVCSPDTDRISEKLERPLRGMLRLDWFSEDPPSTNFHISDGDMFALLKRIGFDVVDFRQLYAPEDAVDHPFYSYVTADWAKKWPHEEIWRARKA